MVRDVERLTWQFESAETELWKDPPDPILEAIAAVVTEKSLEWHGSPTELVNKLELDMQPNVLTKHLNVNAGRLKDEHGVSYENNRNHAGRYIKLRRDDNVGHDDVCGDR